MAACNQAPADSALALTGTMLLQLTRDNGMQALLQQAFRQDAIRREWKQHEAQLVHVATLNDAALFHSTHSAKQHQTLKHHFRQSIRMPA